MALSDQAKRLTQVYKEFRAKQPPKMKDVVHFANAVGVSKTQMYATLKGEREVGNQITSGVINLGYSPDWFIKGKGERGDLPEKKKTLLTKIDELQATVDLLTKRIDAMQARMKYYEEREHSKI